MKTERGWWALAEVGLLTLVLLGGYVGAYYALVQRWALWGGSLAGGGYGAPSAAYPADCMRSFFEPIHQIDRKWIRKKFWESPLIP